MSQCSWPRAVIALLVLAFVLPAARLDAQGVNPTGPRTRGPWLIYTAADGLILANTDGTGRTVIAPPLTAGRYQAIPTPQGDRLMLSTQMLTPAPGQLDTATADLRLVMLPGGGSRLLLPERVPSGMNARLDAPLLLEALAAPPVWSPTGDYVVFASAHDGQPDLYLYTPTSGSVTRLTDSPAVPLMPVWSPDGQRLLWANTRAGLPPTTTITQIVFGGDSGAAKTRLPVPLAIPINPGERWQIIDWLADDRLLYSVTSESGMLHGLYTYDFAADSAAEILPPDVPVQAAAYAPSGDTLLIIAPAGGDGLPPGGYRIDLATGARTLLLAQVDDITNLGWEPALARFVIAQAAGNVLRAPTPDEADIQLPPGDLYPVPDGSAIALHQPDRSLALIAPPTAPPLTALNATTTPPVWAEDGRTLYTIAADGLWQGLVAVDAASGAPTVLDPAGTAGILLVIAPA
jgi:dipeptidyl aminopeptidase/acylaminoacyl peptidase